MGEKAPLHEKLSEFGLFCACPTALEKPEDGDDAAVVRIYHRIRSPGFAASSPWSNVSKGSRQDRSVTSGKGLALRAGCEEVNMIARAWTGVIVPLGAIGTAQARVIL